MPVFIEFGEMEEVLVNGPDEGGCDGDCGPGGSPCDGDCDG